MIASATDASNPTNARRWQDVRIEYISAHAATANCCRLIGTAANIAGANLLRRMAQLSC